ncbi:MAG: hypothetical protein A4E62_00524 [Syntrophorhabdus sp. PtaU1.Bin002]|nr:MAG: hypothetical protein A4E62_00524 [Syntrophorhabdus sp. PtaU1.Bin002]
MSTASLVISLVSIVVASISLFITWRKNIKDRHYANDKELVEQLKQSLNLAYDSLALENGHPVNDRLRWLTAARHIVRYRQLSNELRTTLFKNICEEQEEYWRNKIYVLLSKIESSAFYEAINADQMIPETIEPRSAAIVHSFAVWKEGRLDPLDDMSFEDILQLDINERTISHRLAIYPEPHFPGWNVDCEYNRDHDDVKRLDIKRRNVTSDDTQATTVFPDIIVHRRGTDQNLLVIEMKKTTSLEGDDYDYGKLLAFKKHLGYSFAIFLKVRTGCDVGIDVIMTERTHR